MAKKEKRFMPGPKNGLLELQVSSSVTKKDDCGYVNILRKTL